MKRNINIRLNGNDIPEINFKLECEADAQLLLDLTEGSAPHENGSQDVDISLSLLNPSCEQNEKKCQILEDEKTLPDDVQDKPQRVTPQQAVTKATLIPSDKEPDTRVKEPEADKQEMNPHDGTDTPSTKQDGITVLNREAEILAKAFEENNEKEKDKISTAKPKQKSRHGEKVYLFDTENEGSAIMQYLLVHGVKDSDIYLFYTTTNKKPIEKLAAEIKNNRVHKIMCTTGKNALDFQLVAYISILTKNDTDGREYIVVSKDTGYKPAIQMFTSYGIKISLDTKDYSLKVLEKQKTKGQKKEDTPAKSQTPDETKIHRAKCTLGMFVSKDTSWTKEDKDYIAECAAHSDGSVTKFGMMLAKKFTEAQRQTLYKELTKEGRKNLLS